MTTDAWIALVLAWGFCLVAIVAIFIAWRFRAIALRALQPATWSIAVSAEDMVLAALSHHGNWDEWFTDLNGRGLRMVRTGGIVPMDRTRPEAGPVRMHLEVEAANVEQVARFGAEVIALARGVTPVSPAERAPR